MGVAPMGYCACGRPVVTSAGTCGRWDCMRSSPEGSGLIERLKRAAACCPWRAGQPAPLLAEAASALSAYEGRLEEARVLVAIIGRLARSDGGRTFDDCIRDLGHIDDLCRAALEQSGEGLGSSVASRAGEGLRPFASDTHSHSGKDTA